MRQSPAVSELVKQVSTVPYADLPAVFSGWSQRWPYPRGDLTNWIEPLDRFDSILQSFNSRYGLDNGPQMVPFGSSLLIEGSPGMDGKALNERGFGLEGDRELVEAILVFSKLLVEKCANRAVYNSTDRLNDLLNTSSLSLLHNTLRITFFLAQRYGGMRPPTHTPKFYDFDHDRLQQVAAPLGHSPSPFATAKRGLTSPVKTKSKEKLQPGSKARRGSAAVNPNDLRSLCRDTTQHGDRGKSSTAAPDRDWIAWAHIRVSWTPSESEPTPTPAAALPSSDLPSTPTPVSQGSSALRSANSSSSSNEPGSKTHSATDTANSNMKYIDLSPSDLIGGSVETILRENQPDDMPAKARYELLHQLRVAYGLITSTKSRKELLAVRLLSIASLANVLNEPELSLKLFSIEKPQDFVKQLVSLLHDTKKSQPGVSMYLQTLAMETMAFLAHSKSFASEISAALGAGSSQGLLSQLIQKGLSDIAIENDSTDNVAGDDWRDAIFSMPRTLIEVTGQHGRTSEAVIAASFISSYLTGFCVTTGKAMRVHLRMLDFIKTFFHHFKDGLAALLGTNAFEVIGNLLGKLVASAWDLLNTGDGIAAQQKTRATDYEIPYMHQQIIRSIIDMINDISHHQGAQADRVLRNLVDSQALLRAFRIIVDHLAAFGAHTWSEVIKGLCGFLHNEPTSYSVIFEAGIIQSILKTVNPQQDLPQSAPTNGGTKSIFSAPENRPQGIPPVIDAIVNVSQVFGAICLTNAGFDLFKSSGALEKFFEIFESPAHVKVLGDPNILALLGSTFDELVRHHPNLKNPVLSAVMVMLARVRHISRFLSVSFGAGAKLWLGVDGELVPCGGRDALSMEILPPLPTNMDEASSQRKIDLPNGHTLILENELLPPSTVRGTPSDKDNHALTATDWARPAVGFLMTFFEHQSHCSNFLEYGGCDLVLDFITLPSLPIASQPYDRNGSFFLELASAVHMMAECKPQIVLPALVDRARFACAELRHFCQHQPTNWSCYFGPLVKASARMAETGKSPNTELTDIEMNGTHVIRSMMAVFCTAQVLSEIFHTPIYNQRHMQNVLFGTVNLEDVFADIVKMMGAISAACCREDVALQRSIPESWISSTRPEHHSTGNDEVDKLLNVRDSTPRLTGQSTPERGDAAPISKPENANLAQDKLTSSFKNVQTLRFLLIETPSAIRDFLCRLGRNIVARRRPDTFAKQKTSMVADALASAYLTQLQPDFLGHIEGRDGVDEDAEPRFTYFVLALDNVRRSFDDDSSSASGPITTHAIRQGFVVEAFRKAGGLKTLTTIGTEFFDRLKSCKVEHAIFSANTGLKICLDILGDLTDSKCVMDSAQSNSMKTTDPSRPYHFVPAQLLLNLRMEALPLTRLIWESEYADQASKDVVQKLVSILKHILSGDHENEAVQTDNGHPTLAPFTARKLAHALEPFKINALKEKGYDEELVREALYRSNSQTPNNYASAEDYCRAIMTNPRRRRLPVPDRERDALAFTSSTPGFVSPSNTTQPVVARPGLDEAPSGGAIEAALADVTQAGEDDEMADIIEANETSTNSTSRPVQDGASTSSSAMDIKNLLNNETEHSSGEQQLSQADSPRKYSVESITTQRALIREDLAERCNNILNYHQNLTFELSDLIVSATKKLSEDLAKDYWKSTTDLLTSSLLSMQHEDDIDEASGKKIAAAAHLVALLIQDGEVFKETISIFQNSFEGMISFLKLPAANGRTEEGSYPWVAPVLLILEKMLSKDCEPAEIEWTPPNDLEPVSKAVVIPLSVFGRDDKLKLFDALVNLLPRVGKDRGMALAIARILVALTRTREVATRLADTQNLQKLFLMVRQLASGVGNRLQSAFMLVLRHIVEDDDTLRQIMCSEIKALFNSRTSARNPDTNTYTRELYHLVLRSPTIFVEVTNENVKLSGWQPQGSAVASIVLKETGKSNSIDGREEESAQRPVESNSDSARPAASIETPQETIEDNNNAKAPEVKPPVVEHPDGVVHFILSELLKFKDVGDQEISLEMPTNSTTNGTVTQNQNSTGDGTEVISVEIAHSKPEKAKFKPEDHPIFSYRCFLMYSLTELLHSYNRTKVEFINFSRKKDPTAGTASTTSKPRSGIINYFLNGLIPSCYVDKEDSLQFKKKLLTSDWAIRVVVALCSKTGEVSSTSPTQRYSTQPQIEDVDDESDLTFVRRFALEHAIKAYKDAISSNESLQMKYSRLLCLADMFNRLLTKPVVPEGSAGSQNTSYKVLARMMFEKNFISVLSSSLAEIDLAYAGSKRVIKFILRPLHELTTLATQLSLTSPGLTVVASNVSEDVISSASSVSDIYEEREETPDLFRNSALGMLDPNRDPGSDSASDEEDEDEEMYDEEYEDEMEYDNGMVAGGNDDEAVSDEDEEGEVGPEGEVEGIPGDEPMDIEFVVNDPSIDVDSDADNDEDDESDGDEEDDDDDDDDDDDGEDFEIGEDLDAGEINGDDANHSLNQDLDDAEGEWEDEEADEEDEDDQGSDMADPMAEFDGADFEFEGGIMAGGQGGEGGLPAPGVLSNLLRVLGDPDLEGPGGMTHPVPSELIVPAAGPGEQADEGEEDEDEEGEEMDENEEMAFERDFEILEHADHLMWDHPPIIRRHRQIRGSGGWNFTRRIGGRDETNTSGRRFVPHGRPGGDDGTNPLLRRPQPEIRQRPQHAGLNVVLPPGLEAALPGIGPFPPLHATFQTVDAHGMGGHGAVLDAIFQAIQRGEVEGGQVRLRIPTPLADLRDPWRRSIRAIGISLARTHIVLPSSSRTHHDTLARGNTTSLRKYLCGQGSTRPDPGHGCPGTSCSGRGERAQP